MRCENRIRGKRRCGKRVPGAGERGFAMVLVLAALLMLAVLGATSLLLMVSTLRGVESNKPEDRAFQIAKAGLNVAHAMIVANEIGPEGYADGKDIMGGRYEFLVEALGGYDYRITSSGEYEENGTVYRRKIQETAMYSAERSFDAIRNYMLYAGRDLTINIAGEETKNLNRNEIVFSGNIRAERDLFINVSPWKKVGSLSVNGSVEGKNSVKVIAKPGGTGAGTTVDAYLFGDVNSGDIRSGSPAGAVTLSPEGEKNASATIKAATGGGLEWEITTSSFTTNPPGPNDVLEYGSVVNGPGMEKVFIPEPDLAYYKVLAIDQGNYFIGDKTLTGDLGAMGVSSLAVVYCTGNLTLQNVNWNEPDMKGIFVCEGNFTTNTASTLKFENNSLFQVVARGNIMFANDWQFPKGGSTSEFFFWSGNDAYIELAMFAQQLLQVTAVRDIFIQCSKAPSHKEPCEIFYRGPDIDIAAWPIDIKVYDWIELPSHE
jgi:hypothetical protein